MDRWIATSPRDSLIWLALMRIGFGLAFLSQGVSKLGVNIGGNPGASWLATGAPLKGILANAVKSPIVDPFYRGFLETTVLTNIDIFARLVVVGELLIGLSLALGLFTRVGALGGLFLSLNLSLMKGLPASGSYIDHLFLLAEAVFAVSAAGYVLSADSLFRAALPGWLRALQGAAPAGETAAEPAHPARHAQPA